MYLVMLFEWAINPPEWRWDQWIYRQHRS